MNDAGSPVERVVTLPGQGRTVVWELAAVLGVERLIVIGYSMGGLIAQPPLAAAAGGGISTEVGVRLRVSSTTGLPQRLSVWHGGHCCPRPR